MLKPFEFKENRLPGSYLIAPFLQHDDRGFFVKDYVWKYYQEKLGINHLREVFYTHSIKGVLRGLHLQVVKQQAKLIRCISGKIIDVIVDLRKNSPTFGQHEMFELSGDNPFVLYVPKHFAHGYYVIEDAIVSYQADENFYPEYDTGIIYNDPELAISWPIAIDKPLILSDKDLKLPSFKTYCEKWVK